MTDHKTDRARRAAARSVLANVSGLADTVTRRLVAELAEYRRLPAEEMAGEVRAVIERTTRAFARVLDTGEPFPLEHRAVLRASAARRAEEGIPIEAVVNAYHLGAQACVEMLGPGLAPEELAVAYGFLLDTLRVSVTEVTAGYLEERQALIGERGDARQRLLSALLDGADAHTAASLSGADLPPAYLVLALSLGAHADERRADVDGSVAARRKIRRARAELERRLGEQVLVRLHADRGLVLLPRATAELDAGWATALVEALSGTAGAPVVAGAVQAAPEGVPEAARLAAELRDVALAFDRPPGAYTLDDLLIEYQLTRPGPARDRLAALLAPIADKPELLDTLGLYLRTDLNRRKVAARYRIHPNTVDYRIRRVAVLTGLDPTRHRDRITLTAALAARTV
ncbi:helix-turn-helix domain-containing protein [Actinocorallia sp. API 0066]|uniref:PucR family transcriptional regulator n=1 Tax=Actinocorallia sp. API 0066 TaxID=2896846 RepID=UPI001E4F840C|nr:helix-turn-helix domain-containing protein [Actinocorallia sp. API 0066]MCD0451571.1 helix-turn-helix domain-containing protein [Actinocorallia sp. API 0066]